jgi:hypothetical protein
MLALLAVVPGSARAQEQEQEEEKKVDMPRSPDALHLELSARGSYATPPVRGGITAFGVGGGVGADFVFSHVVLGASVMAYGGGGDGFGSSESSVLYGAEAGYEIRATPVVSVRPMLGLGAASITHTLPPSESVSAAALTAQSRRSRVTSPVDVVTQSSSVSSGGGGGGVGGAIATSVSSTALYVAPGVVTAFVLSPATLAAIGGRILYLPNVPYGSDASAKWLSYSLDLNLAVRF